METSELRRVVKFKYIRHPLWILGLHGYIFNAEWYSKNGAVYIMQNMSRSNKKHFERTSSMYSNS